MIKPTHLKSACAIALAMALPAVAQQEATAPPPPPAFCENNPGFNDWDFWVGEWNVYSTDGNRTFQGTNSVTKQQRNCLVQEAWRGAQGGTGFSMNYFNPVRDEWRQVWVSNGYAIDYTGGLNAEGQMVLDGEIDNYTNGTSTAFKGIWTREDNGDVIQRFEIFNPQQDSWAVWFEGRYVRQETDPTPPAAN